MDFHIPAGYGYADFNAGADQSEAAMMSMVQLRTKMVNRKSDGIDWKITFEKRRK